MAKVLLIVGGGIAAYKSLELVRLLRKAGHEVTPVLTKGGEHFVTAMSLGTLAESPSDALARNVINSPTLNSSPFLGLWSVNVGAELLACTCTATSSEFVRGFGPASVAVRRRT